MTRYERKVRISRRRSLRRLDRYIVVIDTCGALAARVVLARGVRGGWLAQAGPLPATTSAGVLPDPEAAQEPTWEDAARY